jgi:hypothetical protein
MDALPAQDVNPAIGDLAAEMLNHIQDGGLQRELDDLCEDDDISITFDRMVARFARRLIQLVKSEDVASTVAAAAQFAGAYERGNKGSTNAPAIVEAALAEFTMHTIVLHGHDAQAVSRVLGDVGDCMKTRSDKADQQINATRYMDILRHAVRTEGDRSYDEVFRQAALCAPQPDAKPYHALVEVLCAVSCFTRYLQIPCLSVVNELKPDEMYSFSMTQMLVTSMAHKASERFILCDKLEKESTACTALLQRHADSPRLAKHVKTFELSRRAIKLFIRVDSSIQSFWDVFHAMMLPVELAFLANLRELNTCEYSHRKLAPMRFDWSSELSDANDAKDAKRRRIETLEKTVNDTRRAVRLSLVDYARRTMEHKIGNDIKPNFDGFLRFIGKNGTFNEGVSDPATPFINDDSDDVIDLTTPEDDTKNDWKCLRLTVVRENLPSWAVYPDDQLPVVATVAASLLVKETIADVLEEIARFYFQYRGVMRSGLVRSRTDTVDLLRRIIRDVMKDPVRRTAVLWKLRSDWGLPPLKV